jgi:uncharacterized protein YacL (UPF0231 family)
MAALAVGVATKPALAADTGAAPVFQNIWEQLATKLGLPQSKMQTAVDELQKDRQSQAEKNYEDRLSSLVTDGKITASQKNLILEKHKEMLTKLNSWDLERKTYMQGVSDWVTSNNIDVSYLGGGRGGMMNGGGFGGGMGMMGRGMRW